MVLLTLLLPVTSTELIMDDARRSPFAMLNERLRPQFTTSEQIYSSLNRLKSKSSSLRPTVLPAEPEPEPEPKVSVIEPALIVPVIEPESSEEPEEPRDDSEQEDLISEGSCAELSDNSCVIAELDLKDFGDDELVMADETRSISSSEEKDQPGELASEGTGASSESVALDGEGDGSPFQRSCMNANLPDVINSGRLLSRRRTLGHVSETLKEVRREVELSRRRSMKLKAQVDKLQENRDQPGWSQHRERVTDEVLSVLGLLSPLTEPESSPPVFAHGENRLDKALNQLQNVARQLAISHTKQKSKSVKGDGDEDSAILQQALRDRDEAIEKKRAVEEELLRSKTELMMLNNHLLEAVQKRLELSLELETWREDVQRILHQQLQTKQQAEQAQRKSSRLGILRRNKQPPIQRPANFPLTSPVVSPTINPNQIYVPRSANSSPTSSPTSFSPTPSTPPPAGTKGNWMDRLRRYKKGDQDASGQDSDGRGDKDDGFQVVSLD